jgi:hypothetical protein
MNIAIHNIHLTPNLGHIGIHDYVLDLVRDGWVKHLYFDMEQFSSMRSAISFARFFKNKRFLDLPWDSVEFVFSARTLAAQCDVLLNFNTHLGVSQFTKGVRAFNGAKIYHVNDYFWNNPGSTVNKWLEDYGVDYVMGYASHDRYCAYFQKTFPNYVGKVIPVPFGFGDRFQPMVPFEDRQNKCVAVGAVNHLRPLNYPIHNYQEYADFFPDESWLHKSRRLIALNKERLAPCLDSKLPEFPQMKDFSYDLVATLNQYRMFVSCETIFFFPPAKYYEGPACGCVLVCSDHECNKDVGFVGGENCITYRLYDIDDLEDKVRYYQANQQELSAVQRRGTEFVRTHYSHRQIAKDLVKKIAAISHSAQAQPDRGTAC